MNGSRIIKYILLSLVTGFAVYLLTPTLVRATDESLRSHIVSPRNGSSIKGVNAFIVGVATPDTSVVEVSTDNGRHWYRAISRKNNYQEWIYYWSWASNGEHTIVSRAIDKNGNIQKNLEKYRVTVQLPSTITMVQEIIVNDEKVMPVPESEIDPFLSDVSKHFDVIELKIWSHYWDTWTIQTAQKIIDRAHHYHLRVALSSWQYPFDNDLSPSTYHTQQLDPVTGKPFDILSKDRNLYPAIDRGNPQAVEYLAAKWQEKLSLLRDIDYVFFNEDMLQRWSTPWPELATPYWESPTFSQADLDSFRAFLAKRIGPSGYERKFPVREAKFLNDRTELNNDDAYWNLWYAWREELFATWINQMAKSAHLAMKNNYQFQGCIYMQWQQIIDNHKYGVNLDAIGRAGSTNWVAMYVNEHGEDADPTYNDRMALYVSQKARAQNKNFGGFINFYAWEQRKHTPGVVMSEFTIATKYHANMIVTFNAQTFYTKHELYNPMIANLWDQLRSHF